jgi:PASTA domain
MTVLRSFLLRLIAMTIAAALLAGATLTLAADRVRAPQQAPPIVGPAPEPAKLTVPDVTGQAYVFAKGILQDHGFAWHVTGPVQGFAANVVANQNPGAGTVVVDNGAPTVALTLQRNSSYVERGTPENEAPYTGTRIELAANTQMRPGITPRLEPVAIPQAVQQKPARQTVTAPPLRAPMPAKPAPVTPAPVATPPPAPSPSATTPPATTSTTAPAPPAVTPTTAPAASPPTTATPTTPAAASPPAAPAPAPARAPDFIVPGAPKEPRQSQSLPDRAQALAAWLEQHKEPTASNLNYWLYEHAYIVAGAKFGWWHGVEALQTLIAVDQRAEVLWGVGKQSEEAARKALVEVAGRTR